MANIVYGKSLNPVGKDNAKSRRNARRAEDAIKAREIEAILAVALGAEAPVRQAELSRAELACKRKPSMQAARVVANPYTQQIEAASERATLSLVKRKSFDTVRAGATHIVNAKQKMRGKSIPLYLG